MQAVPGVYIYCMICMYDVYVYMNVYLYSCIYIYICIYVYERIDASTLCSPRSMASMKLKVSGCTHNAVGPWEGPEFPWETHGKPREIHEKHIETYGHIIHTKLIPKSNSTISIRSWWSHNNQTELIKFIKNGQSSKFQVVAFTVLFFHPTQPRSFADTKVRGIICGEYASETSNHNKPVYRSGTLKVGTYSWRDTHDSRQRF